MSKNISINYLILIIVIVVFDCHGSAIRENNTSASSLSLHVGNEKYSILDTKESVMALKGSYVFRSNDQTGYVYISKWELIK